MHDIQFEWLGRIEYSEALALQNRLVEQRLAGEIGDRVLFLEHDPVYTIGRTRDRSSLGAKLPHPVVEINRGGQATFHGPGQLVGYFILDLNFYGKDLHVFLRAIEEVLIQFLCDQGLDAGRRDSLTGVWIENRKMASIGIGVKKWISMHGFGLNVAADLSGYEAITPCGISGVSMTSVVNETSQKNWTPETVADALKPYVTAEFARLNTDTKK